MLVSAQTKPLRSVVNTSKKPLSEAYSMLSEVNSKTKNMHLSLAAYSMREALTDGKMDLFGFIDWCAEAGLPGAELTSYYFKKDFDRSYLHELRRYAFRKGVTVSGTSVANNFCLPPGTEKQKEIDQVKTWIDYAAELFAPQLRIFAGKVPDGVDTKTAIGWVAEGIKQVTDHAGDHGIILALENHGGVTLRVEDHLAICDAVGENPWFGINLDTGNYHEDVYKDLAAAAPRAVNVHVKVEVYENNGPKVPADLSKLRDILVNAGYKGWVALEYEAKGDPFFEIPQYLQKLRELFECTN
jgi:sugar phosphate isomerase/epimerase